VLHISNGDTVNERLREEKSCVGKAIAESMSNQKIIDDAFLKALSRKPTPNEVKQLLPLMENAKEEERREVMEDLYWGLMSSREFLFNH